MTADGCGVPAGGVPLADVDVAKESVISGVVHRDGAVVSGAYVRLLDATGEFTAEVPTDDGGAFRFFAAPGTWTLRTLAPAAASVDRSVVARRGAVTEVEVSL